jgi:Domain of unknown function (DUF4190)
MNPMGPMGYQAGPPPNHGLAIASLVCGIIAIVPGCCCGMFGAPISIMALIMGIIAISQINASGGQLGGKSLAIAGAICGGCGLGINALGLALNVTQQVTRMMHV